MKAAAGILLLSMLFAAMVPSFAGTFNIPGFAPINIPGINGQFGIPKGAGVAGGYGYASSGPKGSYAKSGVTIPSTICKERNYCYGKKLTCPTKCFKSYTRVGKGYASGGGGGSCVLNCKKCAAYC